MLESLHRDGAPVSPLVSLSESSQNEIRSTRPASPLYLHLLFSALLLEVLGVLTSSHSLKFRSNTHRKCSLLINTKLLFSSPIISKRHYKLFLFLTFPLPIYPK